MDSGDRLSQIEPELKLSQECHTATQNALEALLSPIEQLKTSSQPSSSLPPAPPPPVPPLGPATAAISDPAVRKPPSLPLLLNLIETAPKGELSSLLKIMWVFSYMTKRDAATWVTMHTEQIIGSNSDWGTWDGFLTEFHMCFTVLDAPALAQSCLNTNAYFMKNYGIPLMSYADDLVKVEWFCAGLKPSIATHIGT
uniref:Gag protein n=1 Tax=Moniliophthora roreri TaxID=221103 RepID=A0A0W0F6E8_MONRR